MKIKEVAHLIRFGGVTLSPPLDRSLCFSRCSVSSRKAAFRLPTISLKERPFFELAPEMRKKLYVIPFGILRAYDNYSSRSISKSQQYALACLLVNGGNPEDDCLYGIISAPLFFEEHIAKLSITLLEGRILHFEAVDQLDKDNILDYDGTPHEDDAFSQLFPIAYARSLNKTRRTPFKTQTLVLQGQKNILTKQQYVALESFVRVFSLMTYGVEYSQFVPIRLALRETLQSLQTIKIPSLQSWISRTLCEMLVHDSQVVRSFAKKCIKLKESA